MNLITCVFCEKKKREKRKINKQANKKQHKNFLMKKPHALEIPWIARKLVGLGEQAHKM